MSKEIITFKDEEYGKVAFLPDGKRIEGMNARILFVLQTETSETRGLTKTEMIPKVIPDSQPESLKSNLGNLNTGLYHTKEKIKGSGLEIKSRKVQEDQRALRKIKTNAVEIFLSTNPTGEKSVELVDDNLFIDPNFDGMEGINISPSPLENEILTTGPENIDIEHVAAKYNITGKLADRYVESAKRRKQIIDEKKRILGIKNITNQKTG